MKGIKLKALTFGIISSMILGTISPIFASDSVYSVENQSTSQEGTFETKVYAQIGSKFLVTIPKSLTLSGIDKKGEYKVSVSGDMAGNELIKVIPDSFLMLSSINKETVIGLINQDKIEWTYKDKTDGTGIIDASDLTAGKWDGIFNFNIKSERPQILMSVAKNQNNEEVEIKTESIAGVEKNDLLNALEQSGQIESSEDIETIVNISTTTDIDKIEIDVSGVAKPGDTIVVVQEKTDEWDYVSTETVDNNNKVTVDVTNSNPVSFIETKPDGSIHVHVYEEQIATDATCTTDGVLLMACECDRSYSFAIPASHDIELVEKKDENGELINKYYECKNCDYSILNLTKLFAGEELSHDCNNYLVSKYDATNHWQECSVCGVKKNTLVHSYSTYWTNGDSCHPTNKLVHTCNCGYSYNTNNTRAHTLISTLSNNTRYHVRLCSKCLAEIQEWGLHTNSSGQTINCSNPGKCITCGYNVTNLHEAPLTVTNTSVTRGTCGTCGKVCADTKGSSVTVSYNNTKFTFTSKIHLPNAASTPTTNTARFYVSSNGTVTSCNHSWDNSKKILTTTVSAYYNNIETNGESIVYGITYKDSSGASYTTPVWASICPEKTPPVINNVTQQILSENNNWALSRQLTFNGTENYCKSITLKVTDENGKIYLNNVSVPVSNKNWTYTFVPDIEANEEKIFTLTATDTLSNASTQTFAISKTDRKAPTILSSSETNTAWSQNKEMTFSAIDEGIGNVKIAFNNINEYVDMTANGTTYSKEYQFSGDVYGSITAAIYYTDAAGNVATQFVKIYNLDNTAPTITNYSLDNKTITIKANDLNSELNLDGSGITGYALTWSPAQPQETDWQSSNQIQISGSGIYYLWAKDLVGNISKPYKIKIIL